MKGIIRDIYLIYLMQQYLTWYNDEKNNEVNIRSANATCITYSALDS